MVGTITGNNIRLVEITKYFMERKLNEMFYINIQDVYLDVNNIQSTQNKVIYLNKYLYGLKQSSKSFNHFMK